MRPSVFVATPSGTLKFDRLYVVSLINMMIALSANKIPATWEVSNSCYVMANRDVLATKFLEQTTASHLLFIDSDMQWRPQDVLRMIGHGLPIVCSPYMMRTKDEWTLQVMPGEKPRAGLLKVRFSGTGMMLIERSVLATMAKSAMRYPVLGHNAIRFFPIRYEDSGFVGEDVAFCDDARACGFDVVADLRTHTSHLAERWVEGDEADFEKHLMESA